MKKQISMLIAFIMAMLIALPALADEGAQVPEPLTIDSASDYTPVYDACKEDGGSSEFDIDLTLKANDEYRELLRSLAKDSDVVYSGATLKIDICQTLATDDMTALTWQVTNVSDMPLYVQSNEYNVAFSGIDYDLCSGMMWKNYLIRPGETINARFTGVLFEHFEPGNGVFTLDMKVYEIAPGGIPEDYYTDETGLYAGGEFFPEENMLSLKEDISLSVPMTMGASDVRSALKDGKPIERDFGRYTLRVTQADMTAADAKFTIERIYDTEEEARADQPIGNSFWDYEYVTPDGMNWIRTAYGSIPDDPVELDDGRWAWRITNRVYFMYAQPDVIMLTPRYFEGDNGYLPPLTDEAIELDFNSELRKVNVESGRKFTWSYGFVQL